MKDKFISGSLIERLHRELRLADVVGQTVRLSRHGRELRGQCPFHPSTTETLRVFPQEFWCASCDARGDAIDFTMRLHGCSFREAVFALYALIALEAATGFYERTLSEDRAAQAARDHLKNRGVSTANKWRLGYAPDGWNSLVKAMASQGIPVEPLVVAGLVVARKNGNGHYDRFRSRLMIPIRRNGRVIAFGARALAGEKPKYLNSPETIYFRKSEILFALDECRGSAQPIVVEGYFDAIALHEAEIPALALCGSVLSAQHLAQVQQAGFRKTCFAFDGDTSGKAAAIRAAGIALGASVEATFMHCPDGLDPDELVQRHGVADFHARIGAASSAAELVIQAAFDELGERSSVEQRVAALAKVMKHLQDAKRQCTQQQVHALAARLGCEVPTMEGYLRDRGLLPESRQGSALHPGGLRP